MMLKKWEKRKKGFMRGRTNEETIEMTKKRKKGGEEDE